MREIELMMVELNVEQETINKTVNKINDICLQRIVTPSKSTNLFLMGNGNGNGISS